MGDVGLNHSGCERSQVLASPTF